MTDEEQIEKLRRIVTDMLSDAPGLRVPMSGPIPMQPASVARYLLDALRNQIPEILGDTERVRITAERNEALVEANDRLRMELDAREENTKLRDALEAANAIIGQQADEAKRLQDTIDRQQNTLRSLAEHEPSWSDDFLRARAALIGVEATLAGEKLCRHCKSPHAMHNARLDFKCMHRETTYEPEDEKP